MFTFMNQLICEVTINWKDITSNVTNFFSNLRNLGIVIFVASLGIAILKSLVEYNLKDEDEKQQIGSPWKIAKKYIYVIAVLFICLILFDAIVIS